MTAYEENRRVVAAALEAYRDAPPDDGKRRFVDWLMKRSLHAAQNDPEGKKYHNLIVLRYISGPKRAKKPICDALHIGRQNYDDVTEAAIGHLLVLAFGVDGIDWGSPSRSPQAEDGVGECLRMAAEVTGLKYSLVAGLLAGAERHIRESAELSEDMRGGILEAVQTAQARLVLNAAFDLT